MNSQTTQRRQDQTCWRFAFPNDLLFRSWDNQTVVYHAGSGDTHLINPIAAESLLLLQTKPFTSQNLLRQVAEKLDIKPDQELTQQIQGLLAQLNDLGLIEPVDDDKSIIPSGAS